MKKKEEQVKEVLKQQREDFKKDLEERDGKSFRSLS